MMLIKRVSVTLVSLLMLLCSKAQVSDTLLAKYNQQLPIEKIYVHFDNQQYRTGNTIWYKAYLRSTTNIEEESKHIYVDWYHADGRLLAHHANPVYRSSASGSFLIPANYDGASIYAVAYTQWMHNFDSAFLFRQSLDILNPANSNKTPSTQANNTVANKPTLRFFPEGGDLVATLPSVLAFKATDMDGQPAAVSGMIRNSKGVNVMPFGTQHAGMGSILFTPEKGQQYTASWTDARGNDYTTELPIAREEGMVLTVNKGSLDRVFNIGWTPGFAASNEKLEVVLHSNQQLLFRANAVLTGKQQIRGVLPLMQAPSGVLILTVFNNAHQPLAERVLFVNNEEYVCAAELVADSINLARREKNVFTVVLPDSISANISVSVVSENLSAKAGNIVSSLLLSSEIRGYVADPDYYFSSDEDSVKQQVDLVMLTNGWRRIKWETVMNGNHTTPVWPRETNYMTVSGKIEDQAKGRIIGKASSMNLFFQEKNAAWSYATLPIGTGGFFEDRNRILFDTTRVFYQLNGVDARGRTKVGVSNGLFPFKAVGQLDSLLSADLFFRKKSFIQKKGMTDEMDGIVTLGNVTVKTTAKSRLQEMNDTYTSGQFKFGDAYQLSIADDPTITASRNILTYIQGKVAGIQVIPPFGSNPEIYWRGINSFGSPTPVALYVNEIGTTAAQLQLMSMLDVAYIKVFRPPFMGAPLGNGGVGAIAVYTKRGNDSKENFQAMDQFVVDGYTPSKEFYAPDYTETKLRLAQPDTRTTLLWKPYLFADAGNNKIGFTCFQNDSGKPMYVTVEGTAANGKLIHIRQKIQ